MSASPSVIQVNPAVQADPSLVRDGTDTIAGSPTGAAPFTPNPPGGPAGFSTLIDNVLTYTLGADVQDGVTQPASNTTGLGAAGTLERAVCLARHAGRRGLRHWSPRRRRTAPTRRASWPRSRQCRPR